MPASVARSPRNAALDAEDSNMSSPLSEVEDKDGENEELENLIVQHPEPQDDGLDSDSNLSEANDTEAETERLYDTPQNPRHKDVILDQFSEAMTIERTPGKLGVAESIEPHADDDSLSDVDISATASSRPESPTKTLKSTEPSSVDESKQTIEGRKRKRSPGDDRTDSEAPQRKRTGSIGIPETVTPTEDKAVHNDAVSANGASGAHLPAGDLIRPIDNKDEKDDTTSTASATAPGGPSPKEAIEVDPKKGQNSEAGSDHQPGGTVEDGAEPTTQEGAQDEPDTEEGEHIDKNGDEEGKFDYPLLYEFLQLLMPCNRKETDRSRGVAEHRGEVCYVQRSVSIGKYCSNWDSVLTAPQLVQGAS